MQKDFAAYRDDPAGFAREVLGSRWWGAQTEIAAALAEKRRVAVKAANGVGKTYLAADLVIWFLLCHAPSVVLTTAPTWRQVESLLWEEIRRRHRQVNVRAEREGTGIVLEGSPLLTKWKIAEGHFAMGLSTDEPVRFQGFHAENLLVVLDEACGVPEEIWEAVEGICVGRNNRVLAISNPLNPTGRFYQLFQSSRWKTRTISALDHPNVMHPDGELIPGAVTREAVEDRLATWCEEVDSETAETGTFCWEGKRYRPEPAFRIRVLGEFPTASEDSLFQSDWLEMAMREEGAGTEDGPCVLAVDVARFGGDETVFAVRHGSRVLPLRAVRGWDTVAVTEEAQRLAVQERAQFVVIDETGIGGGVVDNLRRANIAGVCGVNGAERPQGSDRPETFLNLRAQLFWTLRERLKSREIALPKDETLRAQMMALHYFYTDRNQIQIESKEKMRKSGLPSPDRADALAMLFAPVTWGTNYRFLTQERRPPAMRW